MGRSFENRKASMAKTQGAKAKLYSRYGKEIYICAKNGGVDSDANLALRRLIEKAKKEQVPAHVIDNALKKPRAAPVRILSPHATKALAPAAAW